MSAFHTSHSVCMHSIKHGLKAFRKKWCTNFVLVIIPSTVQYNNYLALCFSTGIVLGVTSNLKMKCVGRGICYIQHLCLAGNLTITDLVRSWLLLETFFFLMELEFELRASCFLDRRSTTWVTTPVLLCVCVCVCMCWYFWHRVLIFARFGLGL
jgi:hypothetical protein